MGMSIEYPTRIGSLRELLYSQIFGEKQNVLAIFIRP